MATGGDYVVQEPLALRVEVVKVERDRVDTFLQQGALGKLFNYSL